LQAVQEDQFFFKKNKFCELFPKQLRLKKIETKQILLLLLLLYPKIRLDSNNNPILYVNISNLLMVRIHNSSSLDQQLC